MVPFLGPCRQCDLNLPLVYRGTVYGTYVVTTGVTVSEISRLLKKFGVADIHVWSLTRRLLE